MTKSERAVYIKGMKDARQIIGKNAHLHRAVVFWHLINDAIKRKSKRK